MYQISKSHIKAGYIMNGSKLILFGIAVAVCALAISTTNIFGICGGILGLIIAVAGLIKKD